MWNLTETAADYLPESMTPDCADPSNKFTTERLNEKVEPEKRAPRNLRSTFKKDYNRILEAKSTVIQ
jgi:dGTP triphosphohydrolase